MDATTRTDIIRITNQARESAADFVVTEEPLEIRVGDRPVSVTLRTPGDDFDLAAGFLFTEGIVQRDEIEQIRHWGSPNVVRVDVRNAKDLQRLQRHFYATSSCGVCGKVSIDALRVQTEPLTSEMNVSAAMLASLPEKLRAQQKTFDETGGIHAAAIFTPDGSLLRLREDVGRHNAVDKVLGSFVRDNTTPGETILVVSSRTSFEIVQKAIVARVPVLAAVGAPSSLAIDLAREFNLTLLGFVRDGRCNLYSGFERITE